MSLGIKDVIQVARAQFVELLPELAILPTKPPAPSSKAPAFKGSKTKEIEAIRSSQLRDDIRLEEIEKEGENWAVTFSVPNPGYSPDALLAGIRNARNLARIAKVVVVDGSEGKLVALRDRAA
jgi:hypothetical protein